MAVFPTITQTELESVGVVGLADTPGLDARAMQEKFEETSRSLLAPKFNELTALLASSQGAQAGAAVPAGLPAGTPATVQGVLDALNTAIDQKVVDLGAGDMARATYDPQGKRQDVFAYAAGLAAENTTGVRRLETVTGALETALRAVKVTLSASLWTGDAAPYSQTVAVDGMTADWIPGVPSIVATDDMVTNQLFQEALACVSQITSADGSLTFLCYKEKPAHYVNIRVPGVM